MEMDFDIFLTKLYIWRNVI